MATATYFPPATSPELEPLPVVTAAGLSHPGREREDNEDAFGIFDRSRLYVVADGMGGRAGGAMAARLTVDHVEGFFRQQQANPRNPWPFPMDRALSFGTNLLAVGFKVANRAIRETAASNPEYHRMGATAAALAVGGTQIVVAHVGDVRVYRQRGGQVEQLTRDHSVVEEIRAARPSMTEAELAAIAHRNLVTRALGTREEVEAQVATHPLQRGDVYLVCSDGLWGSVSSELLAATLGGAFDLEDAALGLIEAANAAGGKDNITALLVRVG
jgi:serine/threonine protein phosphatase PrpC